MNTARHLKNSSSLYWPKKSSLSWIKEFGPSVMLASLLGTYLDLYFVGIKMYTFPIRLFPEIFSINIAFTLIILPMFTFFYLLMIRQVNGWGKIGSILFLSLLMPILEKFLELLGLFIHSHEWKHIYTFVGYLIFLLLIYQFYQWTNKENH